MTDPIQIVAFRQLIDVQVEEFLKASRFLGEPVTAMAYMVSRVFQLELSFITKGVKMSRPDERTFKDMIEPISGAFREIQEFRDRNRHVEDFNHLSTISESILALSWISVKVGPVQFIRDMIDAGNYFGNRVLSANRGNQHHVTWINKWNDVLKGLEQYVKDYHVTGFAWGSAMGSCEYSSPMMHHPPPPPPPPIRTGLSGNGDNRQALLTQINQGIDIVQMLKPVKERDEIAQTQPVAGRSAAATEKPPATRTYPPKFLLEGKKWRVEHQKDKLDLVIENNEMSESLAMFKCENTILEVKNKMNGVTIDNCKRSTIALSDIISSVELIRCDRVKVQCNGHVPLISLDNCDSVQIFLTDKSLDAEIIHSKSTSLNVCLLAADGDYVELAVPEQIKTVIVGQKLQSTVVEKI